MKDGLFLVVPTTYMNESGIAVVEFLNYYKIDLKNLLIIVDDFNIPLFTFRLRLSGSDGGHNGLKSIIYHLGTENFARLRVGIGEFEEKKDKDFVLGKMKEDDYNKVLEKGIEHIYTIVENGFEKSMSIINKKEEK
ncbi:MAG: aminoacyl-tRNA hydrolase [candidate division WOR-3 bacterium]